MKNIFRSVFLCALLGIAFVGVSFGYLEKTAYCEVGQNYIKVYLYKENTKKCADYIYSLDMSIRSVHTNLVTVEGLIDLGYDVEYRSVIRTDLKNKIRGLQSTRSNILDRIVIFENNFFAKIKLYMERHLLLYKQSLEIQLENIERSDVSDFSAHMIKETSARVLSIQNQLLIIENILHTETLDSLVSYIPSYLYLKKEIEGK